MTEMTDAMRRCMHREPALRQPKSAQMQCQFGMDAEPPGRCPRIATRKWGDHWFCDECGSRNAAHVGAASVPLERQASAESQTPIAVFLPCHIPTRTAQQKGCTVRKGKPFFFTKTSVRKAEKQYSGILRQCVPENPFVGPVRVDITFQFPWRASDGKNIKQFVQMPIDTRPDVENLFKMVGDQMTKLGFWKDDSQISVLTLRKVRCDTEGIHLSITPDSPILCTPENVQALLRGIDQERL